MEFTNNTNKPFSAYGYDFPCGEAIDVAEESLANKFGKYEQFAKVAKKAPKKKASKKKAK